LPGFRRFPPKGLILVGLGNLWFLQVNNGCNVTPWWSGGAYIVVDGSVLKQNFISRLVECMNSFNIQIYLYYEFIYFLQCKINEYIYFCSAK
jgi:hypothetical protein